MSEMNTIELFENNKDLTPIVELVEEILKLNDEDLTDETIEIYIKTVTNVINESMQQVQITNLIKSFTDQSLTVESAKDLIELIKTTTLNYIKEKKPSVKKEQLLNELMNFFFSIFDRALDQYEGYSFTLPIKLNENAKMPSYAHSTDAAADLYAAETITLPAHSISNMVKTNIQIELPKGQMAMIVPRSSIGMKTGLRLSNSMGVIDSDYRGLVGIIYDNISDSDYTINAGDRIAQMMFSPVNRVKFKAVEEVNETNRNEGGFGSTGV